MSEECNFEDADLRQGKFQEEGFTGIKLHGARLEGVNLWQAKVESAYLSRAKFAGANLGRANLERADLFQTNLEGVNLVGANLVGANLVKTNLKKANLERAILKDAELKGSMLDGVNLKGADLKCSDLQEMVLKGANLENVDFERANLRKTNFQGSRLSRVNFTRANLCDTQMKGVNLRGSKLDSTILQRANLTEANLSGTNIENADFRAAILNKVNMEGATLKGVNLSDASLNSACLAKAKLENVILDGANLKKIDFRRTKLNGATFKGSILDGTNFENVDLEEANLGTACLKGAKLRKANLKSANLKKANLQGAHFTGCNLRGAIFDGAVISSDTDFYGAQFKPFQPKRSRTATVSDDNELLQSLLEEGRLLSEEDIGEMDEGVETEFWEDYLNTQVENLLKELIPAIEAVDKLMVSLDRALGEALMILRGAKALHGLSTKQTSIERAETYIRDNVPDILATLMEEIVINTIERFSKDGDFTHFLNKNIKRVLKHLKDDHESNYEIKDISNSQDLAVKNEEKSLSHTILTQVAKTSRDAMSKLYEPVDEILMGVSLTTTKAHTAGLAKDGKRQPTPLDIAMRNLKKKLSALILVSGIKSVIPVMLLSQGKQVLQGVSKSTETQTKATFRFDDLILTKSEKYGDKVRKEISKIYTRGSIIQYMIVSLLAIPTQYGTHAPWICAMKYSNSQLDEDETELNLLKNKLELFCEMPLTPGSWRQCAESWTSLLNLKPRITTERGTRILSCIVSDKKVLEALSATHALMYSIGDSNSLMYLLNDGPSRHIREYGVIYQSSIRRELGRIQRIKEARRRCLTTTTALIAIILVALLIFLLRFPF